MLSELDEIKRDFLMILAMTGDVDEASGDADELRQLNLARAADAEFAGLWNRALAVWADDVAAGRPTPILGDLATYSSALLAFLLRVQRPGKYSEDYDEGIGRAADIVESN